MNGSGSGRAWDADGEGDRNALVLSAMRGDQEAVRALWQEHRRWVAGVLLAYKPRDADLEDLVQDVAITLLEYLEAAEDARIIAEVEDTPGVYRFSHALVRETLYDEVRTTRRIRVHRRISP